MWCKLWRLQRMLKIHQVVQEVQHLVLMPKRWKFLVSESFRKLEENLGLTAKQEALHADVASKAMVHNHLAIWVIVSIETSEKWKRLTKIKARSAWKKIIGEDIITPFSSFFVYVCVCVSSCLAYLYNSSDYFYTTEILHHYPRHHCLSVWG